MLRLDRVSRYHHVIRGYLIDLGQRGIRCLLIEEQPEPRRLPKMERCNARSMEIRYAVSNNIGLGGHNGAVIFKRYDGD